MCYFLAHHSSQLKRAMLASISGSYGPVSLALSRAPFAIISAKRDHYRGEDLEGSRFVSSPSFVPRSTNKELSVTKAVFRRYDSYDSNRRSTKYVPAVHITDTSR